MKGMSALRVCLSIVLAASVILVAASPVEAGHVRLGSAALKAAAVRSRANAAKIAVRDRLAHLRSRVTTLPKARLVQRYVSSSRLAQAVRNSLRSGRHFTSRAAAGRPLSPSRAAVRYGLPRDPSHRLTVRLPAGTPVRFAKTNGGARGIGEITTARPLPKDVVSRVVKLIRKR